MTAKPWQRCARGHHAPLPLACLLAVCYPLVPPDMAMLVRAKRDGRMLRIVHAGPAFVNPLTETAEFLDTSVHTFDHAFKGIETTVGDDRVPVNVDMVMLVQFAFRSTLTLENADRLSRTPREALQALVLTAVDARLREATIGWSPEGLRANHAAVSGWVVRAVGHDLVPSGVRLVAMHIRGVTDDNGYFNLIDRRQALPRMRSVLRARGFDPGPDPPEPRTIEEVGAEEARLSEVRDEGLRRRARGQRAGKGA